MNQRHQRILELINQNGKMSVNELAQLAQVSLVTIRNDLTQLEKQNYLKREHGFAVALDRDNVNDRMSLHFSLKQELARFASAMIYEGDSIFIEGGSTNALFARELSLTHQDITIITACTYIATLLKDAQFDVILLGGLLQAKSESVVGPLTRMGIKQTHFNKAFFGIDGFHTDYGFTGRDMLRAEVIDCVLEKGAENYIITDSSKFGQIHPYTVSDNHSIHHVITDARIAPEFETVLLKRQIQIHKVPSN